MPETRIEHDDPDCTGYWRDQVDWIQCDRCHATVPMTEATLEAAIEDNANGNVLRSLSAEGVQYLGRSLPSRLRGAS